MAIDKIDHREMGSTLVISVHNNHTAGKVPNAMKRKGLSWILVCWAGCFSSFSLGVLFERKNSFCIHAVSTGAINAAMTWAMLIQFSVVIWLLLQVYRQYARRSRR